MSQALELAKECGLLVEENQGAASCVWTLGCNGVSQSDIEAFYRASRAEMANEIIAEWRAPYKMGQASFIERLRAIADREGK